jgi:putative cell wall-binding protein/peptidoglycan hydrolase-like protein with peptidoglycan-binding domain
MKPVRCHPVLAVLLAALLMLSLVGPAGAHPVEHGAAPVIVDPRPAPGDAVAEGGVLVAALVAGSAPIERYELLVDGEEVTATSSGGDHPTIGAAVALEPGLHTAELFVESSAGEARRSWRFHVDDTQIRRLSGEGRVETAVAISRDLYPETQTATAAVIARADAFPDALAGVPLAEAVDAPMLLSVADRLSPATAQELRRILPPDAPVYLLGGGAALSHEVATDVEALGFRPQRVAGDGRFDTAAAIAALMPSSDTAIIASGDTFADALAVSGPAARDGAPILLTAPDSLPPATRQALVDRQVEHVLIVGGGGAVSDEVRSQLADLVGPAAVDRIHGATRFETAAAVARRFFTEADTVAVASGLAFPDALAGGRHAAAADAPLLLVDPARMFDPQTAVIGDLQPASAVIYGGPAAVGAVPEAEVRRARVSAGGPQVTGVKPGGGEVESLDEVVVTFDREVVLGGSSVYVTVDDTEAPGALRAGEFPNELVFTVATLPDLVEPRVAHRVDIHIGATDGPTFRSTQRRLVLRPPPATLTRGDRGSEVVDLQRRLRDAGYWVGAVDGAYGTLTHQAVMALQKAHGLARDGNYGQRTRALLESNPARPQPRSGPGSGLVYEIDLDRQILMRVVNGNVEWIFNTSTGHGRVYEFGGRTYRATTTTGRHRVVRQIDGLREAERGQLWRPKYYDNARGIAIHGATSVPAEPASSGCIRVTYAAMDFLWSLDPGIGAGVWVYPEGHYG